VPRPSHLFGIISVVAGFVIAGCSSTSESVPDVGSGSVGTTNATILVGSATPNVVPAGATMQVTFLFPVDGGWIYVNPVPGEGGGLVSDADIGIPGKIVVGLLGGDGAGWLSP
jgi:hypothetical protein